MGHAQQRKLPEWPMRKTIYRRKEGFPIGGISANGQRDPQDNRR